MVWLFEWVMTRTTPLPLHRLISTGHSLGGALASLNAAWWYDVQLPYLEAKVQPC